MYELLVWYDEEGIKFNVTLLDRKIVGEFHNMIFLFGKFNKPVNIVNFSYMLLHHMCWRYVKFI